MRKFLLIALIFIISAGQSFAFDYDVYKLNNGQTVIIKEVKNNPIVIIDTWVKTGSINENDTNNGVSHFLEHLFFKGTSNHPTGEFDRLLESKGAITNAATSKDFTHYYIEIPSKYFNLAMELHSDMILNPMIPSKELEKERKVVMEEIAKDQNNPDDKVYKNLIKMIYTTHPYKREVIGTNEIIEKISREEILNYYKTHYSPKNMTTIVIGDIETNKVLEKIKENFNTPETRKLQTSKNKHEKLLTKQVKNIDFQPVSSGYMMIGYRGADVFNNDTYALDVLSTILGEGRTSVLYQKIKEQKQLAYSIGASNATYKEDGIFWINANFTPENMEQLENNIFSEITNIQKYGVTQEQLDIAKSIIERDTYYSRESISSIASQIGYATTLTNNPQYYNEYLDNIKKVTLSDIKRVSNKYLGKNKSAISIVLPKGYENKTLAKTQEKQLHNANLVKGNSYTKKYLIDNSATLLLSKNDLNDIVAITIYAKGGQFIEDIAGTSDLMASIMLKGTKKYSAEELAKILEENGIKINPKSSTDAFVIEVLTTKPQLKTTLELLNEIINNAKFDDYEIKKVKNTKLNSIKQSKDIPMNIALQEYKNSIFAQSVYSNGAKIYETTLPKIERTNIINYYNKIFAPKNIVISINGNVELNEVVNDLGNIFKTNNNVKSFNYNDYATKISAITTQKTITKQIKDLKAAWVILGWQTAGNYNEKDCATLKVIDALLGTGMSSRLFRDLRENEGLAYQVGSDFAANILKGAFTLYIGTNPNNINKSKTMMLAEIEKLKTEFVTEKELQEAKDKILGKYLLAQETNMDKAAIVGWYETSGRGFDYKDKYTKTISSITASDIIEVANKYFNQNYVLSIVEKK